MALALYLEDSYLKEWDAEVVSVKDDKFVVLDRTAFYPRGGGQPCDTGVIICNRDGNEYTYKVIFVGKFDGEISHEVDNQGNEPLEPLREGDKVHCKLDWEKRYKLMKSHTSAHVASTVFHKQAGALITGNQLALDKVRIDYNLEHYDIELMKMLLEKANKIIQYGLDVSHYTISREEAEKDESLCKLAKGLPPNIQEIRIVKIGEIDRQADAGTHVKNTKEIGAIKFLKCENKGKNNRRLYFEIVD